tara:strand:- start:356 stop:493 length:138 start_codon:yes stop_codon:yes gene_type:complete
MAWEINVMAVPRGISPTAKRPAFEGLGVYAGEMVKIIGLENRSKG